MINPPHDQPQYSWIQRLVLAALGIGLVASLVAAAWLKPDSRGYGTHEQLGLAPCTVQRVFGFRCPSCGMTTAWAELTKGRVFAALAANVGGVILAILAAIYGPWLIIAGVRGQWDLTSSNSQDRRRLKPYDPRTLLRTAAAVLGIVVVEWGIRVFFFSK